MGRSIWSGNIEIGLINVPIRIETAQRTNNIGFSLRCNECGAPISYKKVCSNCGKTFTSDNEILRGLTVGDKEFKFTKEQLTNLKNAVDDRKIKVLSVVDVDKIDEIYFEKSYYLLPNKKKVGKNKIYENLKAYVLLKNVLSLENKGLICKYVFRDNEKLCLIRHYKGALLLTNLYYQEAINELEVDEFKADIKKEEENLMSSLLSKLENKIDIKKVENEYNKKIYEIIESGMDFSKPVKKMLEGVKEENFEDMLKKSLEVVEQPKEKVAI